PADDDSDKVSLGGRPGNSRCRPQDGGSGRRSGFGAISMDSGVQPRKNRKKCFHFGGCAVLFPVVVVLVSHLAAPCGPGICRVALRATHAAARPCNNGAFWG